MLTDDPGHDFAGVNPDASLQVFSELNSNLMHGIDHAQRHVGYGRGVIRLLSRQSASHHVGIPDGFDLFKPQPFRQLIE